MRTMDVSIIIVNYNTRQLYLANLYTLFFSNLIHLTFTPLTVCIN